MNFPLALHESLSLTKTLTTENVRCYAEITGNASPTHSDEALMRRTTFGALLAPGELLIGLMATVAFQMAQKAMKRSEPVLPVSLGFERVRFIRPIYFGETVTVQYTIDDIEYARNRSWAKVEIFNEKGELVCFGAHLMKWLPMDSAKKDN